MNFQFNLVDKLYSFVNQTEEVINSLKPVNSSFNKIFQNIFEDCSDFKVSINKHLEIESILDFLHDELNTGHWSEVPLEVRRAFTAVSYVKIIALLLKESTCAKASLRECLKVADMGLLLGAPLETNPDLLTDCATYLSQQLNMVQDKEIVVSSMKRKHEFSNDLSNLKGVNVDALTRPSLETFNNKYFKTKIPVKLQDCISHWPALTKWTNINYLLKTAGDRTVPIEIGSHYADENWRQKLMTLKEFIKIHFLEDAENIGYLAQHNLFDQIPELRNDIYVPEYCCLSDSDEGEEPDINAWFGPAKTVSPLHYDPKNNILVQVFGTKQLLLYSPNDSPFLYPHDGTLLSNTAQVDPFKPDLIKYPNFGKATVFKCILEAGEMLYVPPKWWHHVTALDKSFSVSFWWN